MWRYELKIYIPAVLFITTVLGMFAGGSAQTPDVNQMTEQELISYAEKIHERVLTLDAHIDIEVTFFTESMGSKYMSLHYVTGKAISLFLPTCS